MNTVEDYSLSALAKVLGRAKSGLHKLAKSGQIPVLSNGRYSLADVQAALSSNVDPGRRRAVHQRTKNASERSRGEQSDGGPLIQPVTTIDEAKEAVSLVKRVLVEEGIASGKVDFQAARTADLILKARERALRLEKEMGQVVDAKTARKAMFTLARMSRDRWINWPAQIAPQLGPELGISAVDLAIILDREVRLKLLEDREANFKINLSQEIANDNAA